MTISEIRTKNLYKLAERSANQDDETLTRAARAMNSFYRLAGFSERLCNINNNEYLYTKYIKNGWLDEMEKREDKWIKRVSDYLKEFNADICYCGIYPSIIERKETKTGGVNDLHLTIWYN